MNYFSFLVIFTVVPQLCKGQRSRTEHEDGWDIRLSIPGEPGQDYPTLSGIPKTSFTCSDKAPGYYADVETDCQVFRVCAAGTNYGFQSFLCPNGTVFNQEVAVCDWWMNVKCDSSELYFNNNIEKFNKLTLESQMTNDINVMLTRTINDSHDRARTDGDNIDVQQSLSNPSLRNGVLMRNSEKSVNNIYIPPKPRMSYINDGTYDVITSSSTSMPQYLLTDSDNFEFKQPAPQTLESQRINGHTHIIASNNRMLENRVSAKLTGTSSTSFLKRHHDDRNEQQSSRNYVGIPKRNENKEKQVHTLRDSMINQKELLPLTSKSSNLNRLTKKSKPSSRVTFKSWILTPTTSSKLILESTPYTPVTIKTTPSFAKFISKSPSYNARNDLWKSQTGYAYNKPTANMLSRIRFAPNFTFSHRTTSPISPSRSYLTPKNLKSISPMHLYLTPLKENSTSHSHLSSSDNSYSTGSHNENLRAISTLPAPTYIPPTYSFSAIKQPQHISNFEKLSFLNIRKEKLSNNFSSNINQDTNKTLICSDQLKITKQNIKQSNSPKDYSYLRNPVNVENSKYITSPSVELQPPFQTFRIHENKTNDLRMLPYFKEIEAKPVRATKKTVNLNFSLPKEIAEYLYQTKNKDSFDKLQILNLGMHNYLVLTNDNVLTNSASTKFIPLGKLIYEESSRIPTNIDDEQELFPNNNSYMVEEEYQDINNDDLTDITNKISDLTSSQFSENETPSKELRAQTSSSKENNATNILFHTKNANTNHFPSNLIHKQLYSGELYNYPVPDVSQLILGEENLIKQEFTKNGQQHTEVLNLQENTFQTPQILEDKSSVETEVTKLDNQFISNGFPSKFQVVPKSNIEFNNTKTNSYDPVHYHDSLKSTEMEGNVLKTKSNIIHGTSLDKLNIKEKTNDGFSESELYKINNSLRSATGREIEIRLIPSISWHIEKEEDIKELLHLIKTKDMGQHRNNFLNKDEPHNEDQINYFNSEIDYTVDHSLTRDKDKDNYKVSGGTYTGPSSYLVSQSSIGSLEPYRDQLMKPNVTLGYNNYKPARIEDLDDRNGYQKVSPLPPFTF